MKITESDLELVNCPLCGGSDNSAIAYADGKAGRGMIDFGFTVTCCKDCGMVFTNPRPTLEWTLRRYSANTNPDLGRRQKSAFNVSKQLRDCVSYPNGLRIIQKFKQSGALLDVGCAAGLFLLLARYLGYYVEGMGICEGEVQQARYITGEKIYLGDIRELGLSTGQYDVVTMWNVI